MPNINCRTGSNSAPTAAEVRELLDAAAAAGWTAYRVADELGITQGALTHIVAGRSQIREQLWRHMRILLSSSARKALPAPPVA